MSTVRIYKVAELLNTTSQEVMALLKRDHGIEVKSASSTIEEVVARQFVERLARQRNIQLPPVSGMFMDAPAAVKGPSGGLKKGPVRAPEPPPKPAAPTLGPPRLVKTLRPAASPDELGGRPAEAKKAYEQAAQWLDERTKGDPNVTNLAALPWDARLEAEVLRREAEMKAKFQTKTLLADLEPLLIDIANLPDHARPEDVRVIKERVQKTEIVAALTEYRDRGINNR